MPKTSKHGPLLSNGPGTARRISCAGLVFSCAGLLFGCGATEDAKKGEGEGPKRPADAAFTGKPWQLAEQCEADAVRDPGPSPLLRVSNFEYDNMIRDLQANVGLAVSTSNPSADVSPTPGPVTNQHVPAYVDAAKSIADTVIAPQFATFAGCATEDATCGGEFVKNFGRRAFRRALTDAEVTRFNALVALGTSKKSFSVGISMATQAMLNSADFLYKPQFGVAAGDGTSKLTGAELASRLSFYLWGSLPDDELLNAADAGSLDDESGVLTAATRMLDARAKSEPPVAEFFENWLLIRSVGSDGKDATTYPAWNPALADAMKTEALLFATQNFWQGLKVADLFIANTSFMNKTLADFYGITGPTGEDFVATALDGVQRFGFLTQGGFLSTQAKNANTSAVKRGKFVQLNFLCGIVSPPPAGVEAMFPETDANATERERLAQHRAEEVCSGCHQLMDPLGLPFEHYDGIGQWRDQDEQGRDLDVSGELIGTKDVDGPYNGVRELSEQLAQSYDTRACYAKKWFEQSFSRGVVATDSCNLKALLDGLAPEDFKLNGVALELTKLDAFRYIRTVTAGGS